MITVKVETAALTTIKINDAMRGKYFMGALSLCRGVQACTISCLPGKLKLHPGMNIANNQPCKQPAMTAYSLVHGIK